MIKRLKEEDRENLMNFLIKEKEFNLFIIGDVENNGFNSDRQDIWADIYNNEYKAVLLRYYKLYLFYTDDPYNYDSEEFANFINKEISNRRLDIIQGKKEVMNRIASKLDLNNYKKRTLYLSCCTELNKQLKILNIEKIKYANINEVYKIADMLDRKIFEFPIPSNREDMVYTLKTGAGEYVYIKNKWGKIISTASTTAENKYSAMIVGVATVPKYRRKGYATTLVYTLTKSLHQKGKVSCLTYDNPQAGKIYRKIGYNEIGLMHRYARQS